MRSKNSDVQLHYIWVAYSNLAINYNSIKIFTKKLSLKKLPSDYAGTYIAQYTPSAICAQVCIICIKVRVYCEAACNYYTYYYYTYVSRTSIGFERDGRDNEILPRGAMVIRQGRGLFYLAVGAMGFDLRVQTDAIPTIIIIIILLLLFTRVRSRNLHFSRRLPSRGLLYYTSIHI